MSEILFGKVQTTADVTEDISEVESLIRKVTKSNTVNTTDTSPTASTSGKVMSSTFDDLLKGPENFSVYADNLMVDVNKALDINTPLNSKASDKINEIIKTKITGDLKLTGGDMAFKSKIKGMMDNPCNLGDMSLSNLLRGPQTDLQGYSIAAILTSLICSGVKLALKALKTIVNVAGDVMGAVVNGVKDILFTDNGGNGISFLDELTGDNDLLNGLIDTVPEISDGVMSYIDKDTTGTSAPDVLATTTINIIKKFDKGLDGDTKDLSKISKSTRVQDIALQSSLTKLSPSTIVDSTVTAPTLTDEMLIAATRDIIV